VELVAETFARKFLERMIPPCGTAVKLIFRMCVFSESWTGELQPSIIPGKRIAGVLPGIPNWLMREPG